MADVLYQEPETLDGVFDALQQYGDDALLLAGGTGLVNLMKQRLAQPSCLVGLRKVAALQGVQRSDGDLQIGAMVTQRDAETSDVIRVHSALLTETYGRVASVRIRNVATVGGGLAHADPSQDPPVSLIALGARVRLQSRQGTRELPLEDFLVDYYETARQPGEVLTHVIVPPQSARSGAVYLKYLPRTEDDYATVSVAALLVLDADGVTCRDARIALGAVGPTILRARAAEDMLRGRAVTADAMRAAAASVKPAVDPATDYRGSAEYKRDMAEVFTRRALEGALARAQGR